jgi:uncharacterized protein
MKLKQKITDGLKNIMKGIGTEKDPRTANRFILPTPIDFNEANNLYSYNWLAGRIVDVPVDEATKKWRQFKIEDAEDAEKIDNAMHKYDVKGKVGTAMKWARVFGGAVIIIIIEGEDPSTPLNVATMRKGSLKNLIVLDRWQVYHDGIVFDLLANNWGKPDYYRVTRDGQKIHHSRVITFQGATTTIQELEKNYYWGLSVFATLREPILDRLAAFSSIGAMIFESSLDVFKIKDFNKLIAEKKDGELIKRLRYANRSKSVLNAIVMDTEDEHDKKFNSFTNLADIMDRYSQDIAGASGIPLTKLLGITPAGLNATGESDMNNYYDMVSADIQGALAEPALKKLDPIIFKSELDSVEIPKFEFLPLKTVTEKEKSEIELERAQKDQIYMDYDVVNKTDIQKQLHENSTYSALSPERIAEEEKKQQETEGFDLIG